MNNKPMQAWAPMQLWIGIQVFLFPFLSLITPSGIGFSSVLFVITLLFVPRRAWAALAPHWKDVRWVVGAFYQRQRHFIQQRYLIDNLAAVLEVPGWDDTLWLTQQMRVDQDRAHDVANDPGPLEVLVRAEVVRVIVGRFA